MPAIMDTKPARIPRLAEPSSSRRRAVEQMARARVGSHCHFFGRADQFEFECHGDVLVVRGQVPTFYLKQVLQSALQDVGGIRRVDNQVAVVSSEGLSSA